MDVKRALEEIKAKKLREARLWERLDPELTVQALVKAMEMSDSCDIQVLLQYSYYLPPQLSEQLYLFGKLYEFYFSGYLREPDLKELLKEIKRNFVDKKNDPRNLIALLLLLLTQA